MKAISRAKPLVMLALGLPLGIGVLVFWSVYLLRTPLQMLTAQFIALNAAVAVTALLFLAAAAWHYSRERKHLLRLARFAEDTASAVVLTDAKGVIKWVNASFSTITGYTEQEAVGRRPGDFLQGPETNRVEAARIGAALRAAKRVAGELVNYRKDGGKYWIGMKIEPLTNAAGALEGFMAIQADITARHEQHLALQSLTSRFNMATRAAKVGVYERDAHGGNVWWSDIMCEIFGQDPATFRPDETKWEALTHPADRERLLAGSRPTDRTRDIQYRIVRPDGTIRHVHSIGSPEQPRHDGTERVAGITLDVTSRVEAEERETMLQKQLLEASHQAGMAEIATGVLHNVGNVLNSLGIANTTARRGLKTLRLDRLEQASALLRDNRAALADFLSKGAAGEHLPDYLPTLATQISSSVQGVHVELETIDSLLQHLRDIVSAQQALAKVGGQREPVDLTEMIESALVVQGPELAGIQIQREYLPVPRIVTDRHKLLQILVNLIGNARDAVADSSSGAAEIRLKIYPADEHICIVVEDSGIGMSQDALSRLWRFGYTTKPRGHGFGLHNSANAAREIGATISAHSDGVGKGSQFIVRLPSRSDAAVAGPAVA